jgi:hypothetical protein
MSEILEPKPDLRHMRHFPFPQGRGFTPSREGKTASHSVTVADMSLQSYMEPLECALHRYRSALR